jgi:broad specificity phosphatase PhoE
MNNTDNITRLDLLRHGTLRTEGLFCAPSDEALSDEGMQALVNVTRKGNWDVIISSPYRRCKVFAEQLAQQKQCDLSLEDNFREMNFGEWTGLPTQALWDREPEKLRSLWESPDSFVAPEGESMPVFLSRVQHGLNSILNRYKGHSILLITHAGVMRAILATALDIPNRSALKFTIDYARLSRFYYYSDGVFSLYEHGVREIK